MIVFAQGPALAAVKPFMPPPAPVWGIGKGVLVLEARQQSATNPVSGPLARRPVPTQLSSDLAATNVLMRVELAATADRDKIKATIDGTKLTLDRTYAKDPYEARYTGYTLLRDGSKLFVEMRQAWSSEPLIATSRHWNDAQGNLLHETLTIVGAWLRPAREGARSNGVAFREPDLYMPRKGFGPGGFV